MISLQNLSQKLTLVPSWGYNIIKNNIPDNNIAGNNSFLRPEESMLKTW